MTIEVPEVKLRALPNFPVNVTGRTGISFEKTSGRYYADIDFSSLTQNPNISAGDVAASRLLVWNTVTDSYQVVPFALAATSGVASLSGKTGALGIGNGLIFTGDTLENDIASEAQARARVSNAKMMTPLRVSQSIGYSPEQYNSAAGTGNATTDTAAWVALAAALVAGSTLVARGSYHINGGTISITGIDNLTLDLRGATFQNHTALSALFKFYDCHNLTILGGKAYGYAHLEILANPGTMPSEYDPASVHASPANYFYFERCTLKIRGFEGIHNAGYDIFGVDCDDVDIQECRLQGIGANYIAPVSSGSIGVTFYPTIRPLLGSRRINTSNNYIFDHAFGYRVAAYQWVWHGGTVGPIQGQHGGYGTELDAVSVVGVHFVDCYQVGFKSQLENYAGLYSNAAAWATATSYVVGNERVQSNTLYRCLSNHVSNVFATDFAAGNWEVSPKMYRHGGAVIGCTFERCGTGVGVFNNGSLDAIEGHIDGYVVQGNAFIDGIDNGTGNGEAIRLQRCVNACVIGNTLIRMTRYGIYCEEFSGVIKDNVIKSSKEAAIFVQAVFNVDIRGNTIEDCGLGAAAATPWPIFLPNVNAATVMPTYVSSPTVFVDSNRIWFRTGDAASAGLMFFDTSYSVDIGVNNRTSSAKTIRIDGSLVHNHFAGYTSAGQNNTYTITNPATDRAYNTTATTLTEVGQVLGTFISDVKAILGMR